MDNMKFYELSRKVPEEAQKQFNNGSFSGTDINPMWRIKKMTEMFGPCGFGWYYEIVSERAEEHHDMTMAIVDINLYIKVDGEWSKPIPGTGGNTLVKPTSKGQKASDEGYKMALTDALSVACKALGVGADIYFSKDKTKYTQYEKDEDGISPVGSAEAAKEAGRKKLERLNAEAAKAAEKGAQAAKGAFPCERCGNPIKSIRFGDGNILKVSDIIETSKKDLNGVYCYKCYNALMEAKDGGGN